MTIQRFCVFIAVAVGLMACGNQKAVSADASAILEPIGTISLPATKTFVFNAKFVEEQEAWINYNDETSSLKVWFLGKTEPPMTETVLRASRLLVSTWSIPILAELGNTAEVSLAQVFAILEYQPNGEKDGILQTNGWANIFYVKDASGTLRGLDVRWLGDAWYFFIFFIENQEGTLFGNERIFSRNS